MSSHIRRSVCIGMMAAFVTAVAADAQAAGNDLPLWPAPKQVTAGAGSCDVKGKTITIPADAGEKAGAVAAALATGLAANLDLPAAPKIVRAGSAGTQPYVLSLGAGPEAWPAAEKKLTLDKVLPTLRGQAYLLEITPQGATIVSGGSWGLLYGAVTLMQLARCGSEGTAVPCVTILDWPDMEMRGAHVTGTSNDHRQLAGAYALDGKVNLLVWENHMAGFAGAIHPELGRKRGSFGEDRRPYGPVVQEVRALGVEVVPLRNMSVGHHRQSGLYPYVFLGDGETYYWAIRDVIDSELEVYTPRYFHLGLDEESGIQKKLLYPSRTMTEWRDVAVECMKHLRRRGVMGMMWTEMLFPQWGGRSKYYKWNETVGKPFEQGYDEFTATFPKDMVLVPWFYWTKSPKDTLDGKGDLRRQAGTGLPVMPGANESHVIHHATAVTILNPKQPNVLGVLTTFWGGRQMFQDKFPRYPEYVRRCAGPFWNVGAPGEWPPEGKAKVLTPFWDDGTDRARIFSWPKADTGISGLACLFDADPPKSVDDALGRLKDDDWRVWTTAREELVAAGLPAAPAILAAMSKAQGEIADRIEGCLSRQARDGRSGRRRGTLDVAKVMPFVSGGGDAVRDIAAELVASCADRGSDALRARIKDHAASASCVRALGLVKDASCGKDLVAVAADGGMPARARAEAARVMGILKTKEGTDALRKALLPGTDAGLQKAALWTLALVGCAEADKEIAALLDSKDEDTRFRAAIALAMLGSSETKKLTSWLSKDRHSLELAAWVMWKTWDGKEAAQALQAAADSQKDETSRKRLEMLAKVVAGKGDKEWKY